MNKLRLQQLLAQSIVALTALGLVIVAILFALGKNDGAGTIALIVTLLARELGGTRRNLFPSNDPAHEEEST